MRNDCQNIVGRIDGEEEMTERRTVVGGFAENSVIKLDLEWMKHLVEILLSLKAET